MINRRHKVIIMNSMDDLGLLNFSMNFSLGNSNNSSFLLNFEELEKLKSINDEVLKELVNTVQSANHCDDSLTIDVTSICPSNYASFSPKASSASLDTAENSIDFSSYLGPDSPCLTSDSDVLDVDSSPVYSSMEINGIPQEIKQEIKQETSSTSYSYVFTKSTDDDQKKRKFSNLSEEDISGIKYSSVLTQPKKKIREMKPRIRDPSKSDEENLHDEQIHQLVQQSTIQNGNTTLIDVSVLLRYPQKKAAEILNIPNSTFSQKWRDATNKRKWPFRTVTKLDKSIQTLTQNLPHSQDCKFNEMKSNLELLLLQRAEECKSVLIEI